MLIKGLLKHYSLMALRNKPYPTAPELIPFINNLIHFDIIPGTINILELMSGSGHVGYAAKQHATEKYQLSEISLTLLDFCSEMLDSAFPQPDKREQANALKMDFRPESFQLVILHLALQDIPKEYQPILLQDIHRILTKRGIFILVANYTIPGNVRATNQILEAADLEREISSGRYIAQLSELIAWLTSIPFAQPYIYHNFTGTMYYDTKEIPSPQREKSWENTLSLVNKYFYEEIDFSPDRPWYCKIPGTIICCRKNGHN
jgi:ubiquinone/menaquinone biosynthesis C-methylase UbiE